MNTKTVAVLLLFISLVGGLIAGGCAAPAPAPAPTPTPAPAPAPKPETIALVYGDIHPNPKSATSAEWAVWWRDEVIKRSGGRIQFKTYFGGVGEPVPSAQYLDVLRLGVLDVAIISGGYTPERLKLASFGDLPYIHPNLQTGQKVVRTLLDGMLGQEARDNGFEPISIAIAGPRQITLAKPIVNKLEDLKGLKFRVVGWEAKTLQALGATGLPVPGAEAVPAIMSGVLDGITMVYWGIESWGMLDVVKEVVEPQGHQYSLLFIGFNPKSWAGLPKDVQSLMLGVAKEAEANFIDKQIKLDDQWRQYFLNKGAKILILSPQEIEQAKKLTAPVIDEWLKDRGELGKLFWSEFTTLRNAYLFMQK